MRILIAIPTLNEADNIESLLIQLLNQPEKPDIAIIDDHSLDGTPQIIKKLQAKYPTRICLFERPSKQGVATAYLLAFQHGLRNNYQYFFQVDADHSHDPSVLGQFIVEIKQGADCVLGSRYIPDGKIKNWSLWRKFLSAGGNIYGRFWLGLPYKDITSGYKCFSRKALSLLDFSKIKTNGYAFQIEMTYRLHTQKAKIKEVPITFTDRMGGKSKMSKKIIWEAIVRIPFMRSQLK